MYIRNFTVLFREYLDLCLSIRALSGYTREEGMKKINLEIRRSQLEKRLNTIGRTANVFEITAKVDEIPRKIYLADINPGEIPLILRYTYKTKNITDIVYQQILKKA